jgi:hypothetical protein
MMKLLFTIFLLLSSFSLGFSQSIFEDVTTVIVGIVMFVVMVIISVVILVIRSRKKKKGLSRKSANFARLVKYFCRESGIQLNMQLAATKMIARDYIDTQGKEITEFFFMSPEQAKNYLKRSGMADMDIDIFYSILTMNKNEFLAV